MKTNVPIDYVGICILFIQIYEFFRECDFYKGIFSWYIL